MIHPFGWIEEGIWAQKGKPVYRWAGVVRPMPPEDWKPHYSASWVFSRTKHGILSIMARRIENMKAECEKALEEGTKDAE